MQKIFFLLMVMLGLTFAQTCCQNNQIKVSGQGKASALPDMATIYLRFNQKGKTSNDVVKALSNKVNQALAVLNANGINNDNYETGSINVLLEETFINESSQIIGQQGQQTLTVKVLKIDSTGQKVGTLVDALALVNGIIIDSVTFDIFDKTRLQINARANAFRNAKEKAQDYASYAGLTLGTILTIDDYTTVSAPPVRAESFAFAALKSDSISTAVPLGQQVISYSTTITFALR